MSRGRKEKECWTPQMEKAFHTIKTAFSTKPVLEFTDFTLGKPFILDSDWCKEGMAQGISQEQEGPDGTREWVIAYGGRKCTEAEQN